MTDPALGRGLRILLAEDDPLNQKVGQLVLSSLGHSSDLVSTGVDALAALVRHLEDDPYDVVLLDVRMPVMDGLETARRIRAELPAHRQPHIVALTASVLAEDRQACVAAGMDGYLAKPVRRRELLEALRSVEGTAPGPAFGTGAIATAEPGSGRGAGTRAAERTGDPVITSDRGAPAIDLEAVDRLATDLGDPAALADIVELYLADADLNLAGLAAAARDGDTAAVLRIAHAFRPGSAALGATVLVERLEQAERVARAGAVGLPIVVAQVATEFGRVRATLSALAGPPDPTDPKRPTDSPGSDREPSRLLVYSLRNRLAELRGVSASGGDALVAQLVASYRGRAPGYLSRLESEVGERDAAAIATTAHSLAGMAANIGARTVPVRCAALAAAAGSGDWRGARHALAGLRTEIDNADAALHLIT